MNRTFSYSFEPAAQDPVKAGTVELDVADIEMAGIKEILQTPGATMSTWSLLDALLEPTGPMTPFVFREPLGQAREVKVAMSGLFGRFVARAYLERYFQLSIFTHLGRRDVTLDGRRQVTIERTQTGDLPDWIVCSAGLADITIAEAKGCHDGRGPYEALDRAWNQVHRVEIQSQGGRLPVKRIAVATRWASAVGGKADPVMAVRDPTDDGDIDDPDIIAAACIGLARRHVASLIRPLGYEPLADALVTASSLALQSSRQAARRTLDQADVRGLDTLGIPGLQGDLLGGFVTKAGPLRDKDLSLVDQDVLRRLDLKPLFIGVERELVEALIGDDPAPVRKWLKEKRTPQAGLRTDGSGTNIVDLTTIDRGPISGS